MHGAHRERSPSCKRKAAVTPRSHSHFSKPDLSVTSLMLTCAVALWCRASACGGYKAGVTSRFSNKKPFLGVGGFPSACSVNDWPWNECGTRNEGCPRDGWLSSRVPQGAAPLQLCQRDQVRVPPALPLQAAEAASLFERLLISPVSTSPCKWKIIIEKSTFRKSKTFLTTVKPKCEH